MDIHGNYNRNVYTTSSGNSRKILLAQRLSNYLYYKVKQTPGFCKHVWRPISFTLVVENSGIGYVGREYSDHMMSALKFIIKNSYIII